MMIEDRKKALSRKILLNIFFTLLSAIFVVPLLSVIFISLTSEASIVQDGYPFFFREIDFTAYKYILSNPMTILNSYKVTLIVSIGGTFLYLLIATLSAYSLSRPSFKYRQHITFYFFFTMLFSGGLVPSYILITQGLHLKDTYWALILPMIANVWYLIMLKTFFSQIPLEIIESASVDGASQLRIYAQMVLPLSKPVLATVGLLMMLDFWNSWQPAMLYIEDKSLYPLQYLLQVMLRNIMEILKDMQNNVPGGEIYNVPSESVRMAMCLLAVGPMLFVFPFFQKYFTKGLTVGAVKG